MVTTVLKLFHRRRRGVIIKTFLFTFFLVVLLMWAKQRINNYGGSSSKISLSIGRQNSIREEQKLRDLSQSKRSDKLEAADEFRWLNRNNRLLTDGRKQIPRPNEVVDGRTDEEKRLDEEIEMMRKKVVPGLGENGRAVHLEGEELKRAKELKKKEAFNIVASDMIAYNRSVPDNRNSLCKQISYSEDLPTASVIIIFTNEAWSPLLRTVHSVINRTPDYLLHEVILLDDFSDRLELKQRLDRYVSINFSKKVNIIRAPERLGLIRARLAGAKAATGDVLVFLDSHCECSIGWIEPLLQRIKEQRNVALVPIIEVIDDDTMAYVGATVDFFQVGSFTWSGHFTWINIPDNEQKRRASVISPTRSATMAGGLFAIDRKYFWEIGGYDEGMDIWGGENLELSFRVWMCGGLLENIPCSRVGHIFRSFHPYTFPGDKDTHGINTVRMAEVWMDEYKRLFYLYRPDLKTVDYGDISKRIALRKQLKCKDFKWFLETIVPEKYILDEDSVAYGRVKNGRDHLCLDHLQQDEEEPYPLGLYVCHKTVEESQFFTFSKKNQLRREETCAMISSNLAEKNEVVNMVACNAGDKRQQWKMTKDNHIVHVASNRCLDSTDASSMDSVKVKECTNVSSQVWIFDNYTIDAVN